MAPFPKTFFKLREARAAKNQSEGDDATVEGTPNLFQRAVKMVRNSVGSSSRQLRVEPLGSDEVPADKHGETIVVPVVEAGMDTGVDTDESEAVFEPLPPLSWVEKMRSVDTQTYLRELVKHRKYFQAFFGDEFTPSQQMPEVKTVPGAAIPKPTKKTEPDDVATEKEMPLVGTGDFDVFGDTDAVEAVDEDKAT